MRALEDLRAQLRPESMIGLLVAAIALIALAGYLYVIKPSLREYQRLAEKRAAVVSNAAFDPGVGKGAIAALETEVTALRDDLYGGAAAVPVRQVEAFVIDSLDRMAESRSVELVSVKPEPVGEVLMFEELPYAVRVEGGYFDLYDWLRDVETELRPMVVKQFTMRPEAKTRSVSLELKLVAYRSREGSR